MILITGASGNVGAEIVKLCEKEKIPYLKSSSRDIKDHRLLDFDEPETFAAALEGVTQLFLVRPPALADIDRYFLPFIEYLPSSTVTKVVFLSILGAEGKDYLPHRKIEKIFEKSPVDYVFLRASFFMQNLTTVHRDELEKNDSFTLPAGKGQTSFIDVRDIAEAALYTLRNRRVRNCAFDLTGAEALDYHEAAKLFSSALNRTITYKEVSPLRFFLKWLRSGSGFMQSLVMTIIYTVARSGNAARISTDIEPLLKNQPRRFREFAEDYALAVAANSQKTAEGLNQASAAS